MSKSENVRIRHMSVAAFESTLDSILRIAPTLHGSGTFSEKTLRALARHASARKIRCSVETGSGASTLLLSHLADWHIAFTVDSGSGSLENVRRSPLFRPEVVTVVEGPTQLTLPRYQFTETVQFALIDGPHGYPFPDLEYYHIYPHVEPGGMLVLDDIQIRTIHHMFEFLSVDDMWRLEEVVENTAFFARTDAPTFPPTRDRWYLQKYNDSGATRYQTQKSVRINYYIDNIGPVLNPIGRDPVQVPLSQDLVVSGWAIDEANKVPIPNVHVVIDDVPYPAHNRVTRHDVAAAFKEPTYQNSGFRHSIPASRVTKGSHILSVRVIGNNGETLVESPGITVVAEETKAGYVYQPVERISDYSKAVSMLAKRVPNQIKEGWVVHFDEGIVDQVSNELARAGIPVLNLPIDGDRFAWYFNEGAYSTKYPNYYGRYVTEKALEHFLCLELIKPSEQDVVIDVASEHSPLPEIFKRLRGCTTYAQDIMFEPGVNGDRIGGDACAMPLADGFASAVTLTCSFEHFEGDGDIRLFRELARVLRPGGRAVIVPLYLYLYPTIETDPTYTADSDVPFDPEAVVHCAEGFVNRHARFYSADTLKNRICSLPEFHFRVYRLSGYEHFPQRTVYARFVLVAEVK